MRALVLALALIGACKFDPLPSLSGDGGGGDDDGGTGSDACVGIGCNVEMCDPGDETTISGTVYMPNEMIPLAGVDVYVPAADPGPMPTGLVCERCGPLPGSPVVKTRSAPDGTFRLVNVPSGADIPVVITIGKWRRQIRIPNLPACEQVTLGRMQTRLPRNRTEGDMPRIAVMTGQADALECIVRKLGIDDSEFGVRGGTEPVQMYTSQNAAIRFVAGGASFPDGATLWNSTPAALLDYDAVILSCEGTNTLANKPATAMMAMKDYVDRGGRVFAAHFHNVWLGFMSSQAPEWRDIALFQNMVPPIPIAATIDTSHPAGMEFSSWLFAAAPGTTQGVIQLQNNSGRSTVQNINMPDAIVQYAVSQQRPTSPQIFSFEAPVEAPMESARCGRFVFSDMHQVSSPNSQSTVPVTANCNPSPMAPQDLAMAYMLFDMQRCNGAPL